MAAHSGIASDTARPSAGFTAGMIRKDVICPHNGKRLPVSFWYPATSAETKRREGIYELQAAFDASPVEGSYGLVVISHGSGGSDINHHDWAEALARAGYVVAAPRHIGDSHDFDRGIGSREQLLERPRQLRAALRHALEDETVGRMIDKRRVGIMGFSAGAYTSLILLGACPDFSRWDSYCRIRPEAAVLCPVGRTPNLPRPTAEDWEGIREPLIKAGVLLAPFSLLFDPKNIAKVDVPVRLYRARDEKVATNPENADQLHEHLLSPHDMITVPGGHYVFIAPIEDALARKYPEYYVDSPGVDRQALHARMACEIVAFFDRQLSAG